VGNYAFNGMGPPTAAQRRLINEVMRPQPGVVKQIDLCCGLAWGKSTTAVQIAALLANSDPRQRILYLEPDWSRVNLIFRAIWEEIVPPELYRENRGQCFYQWYNGARIYYAPRVITGTSSGRKDRGRGPEYTVVIDDESAIGFDLEQHQNQLARIRRIADVMAFLTLSTPQLGPYGNYLNTPGHKVIIGKTADNTYLPDGYVDMLRAEMSEMQFRRECLAELVALEGRIWKDVDLDKPWPRGNTHHEHTSFREGQPWWLFCDLGSANAAFVVVQQANGRAPFSGPVWVAVADYCPAQNSNAADAFDKLRTEFGTPVAVVAGEDLEKGADTDGRNIRYFVNYTWGPEVMIHSCSERRYNKLMQWNRLAYLFRSTSGERRLCVARDFVALDTQSKRGVIEMIEQDQFMPEDKRRDEPLPKNREVRVQHVRDALLMGAAEVMAPPSWYHPKDRDRR
jgi:hypothetical protein